MSTKKVKHRIDEVARRVRRVAGWSIWLRDVCVLIVVGAGIGLLDLLFPLPETVRRLATASWLVACVAAIAHGVLAGIRVHRRPAEFFATLLERGRGLADNSLINAVQFSHALAGGCPPADKRSHAVSVSLMQAQISRADEAADRVSTSGCVDRTVLRRWSAILAAAVLTLVSSALIWPEAWAAVAPRFYDPAGDHPPYCRTRFAVRYETDSPDGRITRGDSARVVVDLSGRDIPDQAWLTLDADASTQPARNVDLFRRSETQWFARFDNVQRDLCFRVHVPRGYSKLQRLALASIPRITAARVRYTPPADTGRRPYEKPLDTTGIREARGTAVTLTLESDRTLRDGELVSINDGQEKHRLKLRPVPGSPKKVSTDIVLEGDGHLTGNVTGADGLGSRDRVEADLHPVSATTAPAGIAQHLKDVLGELRKSGSCSSAQGCREACRKLGEALAAAARAGQVSPSPPEHAQGKGGQQGLGNSGQDGNPSTASGRGEAGGPDHGDKPRGSPFAEGTQGEVASGAARRIASDRPPSEADHRTPNASAPGVEIIRPDEPVSVDLGPIRGERMPARYKELTEAYFRRLAEDNR